MRVFFHADIEHGQAAVVWRCRDILKSQYGIEIESIDVCAEPKGEPELLLVHTKIENWPEWLTRDVGDWPVVVLERIDGAQLTGPVRRHLGNPRLRAVIKNSIFRDWTQYNRGPWRSHEALCGPVLPCEPADPISEAMAAKLKLGFSFAAYPHYDPIRNLEPIELSGPRPYVGHFAGTTDYGPELGWLNNHRRAAVEQLAKTAGPNICFSERAMNFPTYFQSMREAEFVISPWGLGEPCYRDFEAVMSGCMVINPDTRHIVTVPHEFYRIPQIERSICRPDFLDLADIIRDVQRVEIGDRIQWAAYVAGQNSPAKVAGRLARIFRGAVKPAITVQ